MQLDAAGQYGVLVVTMRLRVVATTYDAQTLGRNALGNQIIRHGLCAVLR